MIVPDDTFRSVLKFGGSCLKSSQDISAIAERISEIDHYPVVVVSAFFGVTDRLFDAIHEAKKEDYMSLHLSIGFVHIIPQLLLIF